jgi:branched-chain amino acid transport system substrate-binding protein
MSGFRMRAVTLLAGFAMFAMACGGSSGSNNGSSSDCSKGSFKIGSDLPTSGADASSGLPAQEGAAFAVMQHSCVQGYKVTFTPYDDAVNGVHDPQKGVQNVQQMISDNQVLGMVGPFNSNVAKAEIPVANNVPLAMISPSNTNECLTQNLDYCQKSSGFTAASLRPTGKNNYFRMAAADTFQGPAMADFAIDTLSSKKAAVWDDQETFGLGVANNFAKEYAKKGGTVVSRKSYDPATKTDFKDFLTDAKSNGADAIYVGATSATKGCFARAQSNSIFPSDVYYLGPDGIGDPQCIKDSGSNANDHMYASQGVADATQNADAAAVVAAYKKQYTNATDVGAYTFASYDCAAILLDAIGRAIQSNGGKLPTRQQVIDAVAATKNYKALSGVTTFTSGGDPTQPTLQIQQVKKNSTGVLDWIFVKQLAAPAAS